MPVYTYSAKDLKGRSLTGQKSALNEASLIADLKAEGLFLLDCSEEERKNSMRKMSAKRLTDFNQQLGTMLESGITLARSIEIMLRRDLQPRDRLIYEALYDKLLSGQSLSEAAREMGSVFPELLISMYTSGEANGTLGATCLKMADHYLKEYKLKAKIKGAMTYPIILFVLLIIVMVAIFTLILPRFLTIYGDMELPGITKAVIGVSKLFTDYWLYTLITVVGLVCVFKALTTIPGVKYAVDRTKLKIPKIGKLMRTIYTARFARTLSSLYSTGISILNALEIGRGTVGNEYIARQFEGVIASVRNGGTLSAAIKMIDGYDPMLASTIMVGEETGKLDTMLTTSADSFDYEAEQATTKLTTMVEPIMIIIMAVLVCLVMVGVMLPIFGLYDTIGNAAGGL